MNLGFNGRLTINGLICIEGVFLLGAFAGHNKSTGLLTFSHVLFTLRKCVVFSNSMPTEDPENWICNNLEFLFPNM